MNIFLGIVFLAFSTLIGLHIGKKYKQKVDFLQDFYDFLGFLENNVAFLQDSTQDFLAKSKQMYHKEFCGLLTKLDKDFSNADKLFNEYELNGLLSKEESLLAIKFFKNLGRLDSFTQIEAIKQTKIVLYNYIQDAVSKNKKTGMMCGKLGIMCGLVLFIIVL